MKDLNSLTYKVNYPLGNPDQIIAKCRGMYVTLLDIQSAYFSIPIREEDREKTSFFGGDGNLYHWNVMTQGLSSAPGIWTMLMKKIFSPKMGKLLEEKYPELWKKEWTKENWFDIMDHFLDDIVAVSYTNLTLPTSDLV